MVTASTCNCAGGAVSHPLAFIPRFLPGRGLRARLAGSSFIAKLLANSGKL